MTPVYTYDFPRSQAEECGAAAGAVDGSITEGNNMLTFCFARLLNFSGRPSRQIAERPRTLPRKILPNFPLIQSKKKRFIVL
jgi:hypothetical protein